MGHYGCSSLISAKSERADDNRELENVIHGGEKIELAVASPKAISPSTLYS